MLTVIEHLPNGKCKCLCDCGEYKITSRQAVRNGDVKHCGCQTYHGDDSLLYKAYRNNGGYNDADITFEHFKKLSQQNCYYCGAPPSNTKRPDWKPKHPRVVKYNGLDRIDNNKPHTIDNVVTSCYICNRAKNKMTQEEFFAWARRINSHLNNKGILL